MGSIPVTIHTYGYFCKISPIWEIQKKNIFIIVPYEDDNSVSQTLPAKAN